MSASRVAGGLLVASLALWLPVGLLPARIWAASLSERLELIAQRRRAWRAANLSIGAAAVLLVAGVAVLAQVLVTGDSLPVLYHVAPALIGVSLVAR